MAKYVLRDFPGVQEIERRLTLPNAGWAAENDNLTGDIDKLSELLFGITESETFADLSYDMSSEQWALQQKEWELNFKLSYLDWAKQQPVWELLGWDLTDGENQPLACAWSFDRQILCAAKGLRGRLPNLSDVMASNENARLEDEAENWASSLARDAEGFRRSRR